MSWIRTRDGRRVAGVCAGLAEGSGVQVRQLRLLFALAAVLGGIGIIVYAACWLILPLEDGRTDDAGRPRGVVVAAWAAGALVATVTLAVGGAIATMFGLGWVVFGVALLVLVGTRLTRARVAAVGLGAVAALALPATAVALAGVRVPLSFRVAVRRPPDATAVDRTVYRTGLAVQLIDLRATVLPRRGVVSLRIRGGVRPTIVALPSTRCVRVVVDYSSHPFAEQLEALVAGYHPPPARGVALFGRVEGGGGSRDPHGVATGPHALDGPTLLIHFTSAGGNLLVRDFPATVSPLSDPLWPGPEPQPRATALITSSLAPGHVSSRRYALTLAQLDRRLTYDAELAGPCAR